MAGKSINYGLLVTLGLPVFAIVASVGVAIIAFTRGDPTLPDEYHWEGMQLDRDFADARRASDLDVRATLRLLQPEGICRVILRLDGAPPRAIQLNLVHGTRPDLDRQVRLLPGGEGYEGRCGAMPSGHWHLELVDGAGSWSVHEDISGTLDGASISARPNIG
jgi:hypothetical protein